MATTENKHVFMRPIEITASQTITFPLGLVTATAGVYANVATLCASLTNQAGAGEEVLIGDDGYVGIYLSAGGNVTFNTSLLATALGYTNHIVAAGAGSVSVADLRSPSVWISEHQIGNQGHWMTKPTERFAGATAGDGTLAGNVRGPRIYHRKFSFPHESAANVSQELSTYNSGEYWISCFEIWSEKTMTAYPDENNVPLRGFFWFVDFYNTVVDNSNRTAGGVEYTYYFDATYISGKNGITDLSATYPGTVTPNEILPLALSAYSEYYLFCMMPERGTVYQVDASVPAGRGYYNVDFDCHTAGQPTNGWTFTT